MPSPEERLQQLRRQRALVQEHLAWIDHEIAAASGGVTPPAPTAPSPVAPPPAAAPANPAVDAEAEAIIENYRAESRSSIAAARRGCFIVFFAGLALFGLAVLALYFYTVSRHPPPH